MRERIKTVNGMRCKIRVWEAVWQGVISEIDNQTPKQGGRGDRGVQREDGGEIRQNMIKR